MTKRALVLGSQIKGLAGVEADTRRMTKMLEGRGFVVDRRTGERATRAGILEGYDRLIRDSHPDDAAVIYYSGHGAYVSLKNQRLRSWQSIVPTDIYSSTDNDWRGITAWELSIRQAQLAAKTKNVTVILDCCHAAQMSRAAEAERAVPRALRDPVTLGFEQHLAALQEAYGEDARATLARVGGSPDVVRLVACGEIESAYEVHHERSGETQGVFTSALLEILEEVGDADLSWAAVSDAIRARVLRRFPLQRPDVEGPKHRRLFSLVERDGKEHVTVCALEHGFQLPVGRITGATLGDVYGVMKVGTSRYEARGELAQLEITAVQPLTSLAKLRRGARTLPEDAIAFPIVRNAVRYPVRLEVPAAHRPRIEQAIAVSPTLRVAAPGELDPVATLKLSGQDLTIEDAAGPLYPATRFPDELTGTLKNVANLGVARGVRELLGEHGVFKQELSIEFGVVEAGDLRKLDAQGCELGLGDRIYIKVASRKRRLFVHIFNVGVRHTISLLTDETPAGAFLDPGDDPYVLGQALNGDLVGQQLLWPVGLPKTFPRLDELIVIATTKKVDLTCLETREFFGNHRSSNSTELSDLLAQLQDGLTRDVGRANHVNGYYAERIFFHLHPRDEAMQRGAVVASVAPARNGEGTIPSAAL